MIYNALCKCLCLNGTSVVYYSSSAPHQQLSYYSQLIVDSSVGVGPSWGGEGPENTILMNTSCKASGDREM